MKVGLFTDPHYSSALLTCGRRKNSLSLDKIKRAMADFERQNCELAVCLGDLVDNEKFHEDAEANLRAIREVFRSAPFPVYCLMGNHDAFLFEPGEFYGILGEEFRPTSIHRSGVNLLFMDACYYSNGEHYQPQGRCWQDSYYPHEEKLERELQHCGGKVYLFIHQNLDPELPEDYVVSNAAKLCGMFQRYPSIQAVYQGHYHAGHQSRWGGIQYITLPAMCEFTDADRVAEL